MFRPRIRHAGVRSCWQECRIVRFSDLEHAVRGFFAPAKQDPLLSCNGKDDVLAFLGVHGKTPAPAASLRILPAFLMTMLPEVGGNFGNCEYGMGSLETSKCKILRRLFLPTTPASDLSLYYAGTTTTSIHVVAAAARPGCWSIRSFRPA